MAKTKKKQYSKSYSQQKRHRRQWVTFMRMCRYGVNNFTRNAWLTIAATAVMTITLLIIFVSFTARNVLVDTTTQIRDSVSMSIYLATDTKPQDAEKIADDLRKLSTVTTVSIKTPADARSDYVQTNKSDASTLSAVTVATNKLPWTLSVKLTDINDTQQLEHFVATDKTVKATADPAHEPSFAGPRKAGLKNITNGVDFTQKVGIGASVVFVAMSMLIIFNTIRMAIFNRREEIQMMKLIGAEKSFIRGPFVVEAMVYGFFAAIIASGLGYTALILVEPSLSNVGVNIKPTVEMMINYAGFFVLAMIAAGALIGIVSSLMATRRYLKL